MQHAAMHFGRSQQRLEPAWTPESTWEAPLPVHVTPQSMQNLDAFANVDDSNFGMADAQGAFAAGKGGGRNVAGSSLLEPRHVGAMLTDSAQADFQSALEQFSHWKRPMHVAQTAHVTAAQAQTMEDSWMDTAHLSSEQEKLQEPSEQPGTDQQQRMSQMVQLLQTITAQQGLPLDGEFFQQTLAEIAKRMPGFDASASWGGVAADDAAQLGVDSWVSSWANAAASMQSQSRVLPGGGMPGLANLIPELGVSAGADAIPSASAASSTATSASKVEEAPVDKEQRVEELNRYIRQQAHEYIEGQAEWSRQIAEVRSESLRDVEKVRREKEEVERQARQELLRLKHRIRELGGGDEAFSLDAGHQLHAESDGKKMAPWAEVVGMDEHRELQKRCNSAEDRIKELEQYIKANSGSDAVSSAAEPERDEQVNGLQQTVQTLCQQLQQAASELHALRFHHQHKVLFWEQGARRLLAMTEQFFGQNGLRGLPLGGGSCTGSGDEEENGGRFGKTATKVHVTLSPSNDKDGSDVGSLQRLLKDALKNGPKDKGAKRSLQMPKEEDREEREERPESESARKVAAVASDSIPSSVGTSRETSPSGRAAAGCQVIRDTGLKPQSGGDAVASSAASEEAPAMSETARVAHFMAQLATDLRHLLGASQQAVVPQSAGLPGLQAAAPAAMQAAAGEQANARPAAGAMAEGGQKSELCGKQISGLLAQLTGKSADPAAAMVTAAARAERLHRIVEGLAPARKGAAQHIVAVERALRCLDRDLRGHCQAMLGSEELGADHQATASGTEAQGNVPMDEHHQLQSLIGLRQAQQQSSLALAEFVQLPQKLKTVFDLTKHLSSEAEAQLGLCSTLPTARQPS
eukprot:gb/GFBE01016480.1/.p1 GENE.gb/GFBE01016480.1/~~gb/GFBE01016480.1/.p1  ORF type:complete len:864 (+),score=212.45 gb/GFBE01016480.1/:1-2592(+)